MAAKSTHRAGGGGMAGMSQVAMEEFLGGPRIAHLVTLRPDGSPHVAPVWYEYVDGLFLIWTGRQTRKFKNLAGDGRAALSIASEDQPYRYVSVEGDVTVSDADVWAVGFSLASRYLGAEGAAAFLEEYYVEGQSVVLQLTPRRIMAWTDDDADA